MPERALRLNGPSLEIVERCDGKRSVRQIISELQQIYSKAEPKKVESDILDYLARLHDQRAIDFAGGEPLARTDIIELIRASRTAGLYVNLITSGMPLDEARLAKLIDAGLDHLQLSFQGAREETANEISGTKAHAQKLRVLDWL